MNKEKIDSIEIIISNINELIINYKLEKIIEMTYSYKDLGSNKFFNITLFSDFAGIVYSSNMQDFLVIKNAVENKLEICINKVDFLIGKLRKNALDEKGHILYKSLVYIKKILNITSFGLIFELEKFGYISGLTNDEKELIVKKIEVIEEENFGLKIKNSKNEIKIIYDFLFSLFVETKAKLEKNEQIFFLNFINKLNNFLDKQDLNIKKVKKHKNKAKFWSKNVQRDKYMNIFNFILKEIYGLAQEAIITDASSIYDGEKFLEIPNKDTHKELTYKRVLELIVHEIESHYINSYNNKILLGNFRGARNLEKEEGLAKVMEAFLNGDDQAHATFVPTYMAKILFSEIYDGDDFYKFIEIFNKMHTLRRHPINEFLRQKRNYSLSLKGGQHKDISYGRGMIKVLDYLNDSGDFSKLFLGKVGFEDLNNLSKISESYKDKLLYPIFIGDIIVMFLQSREDGVEFNLDIKKIVSFLENKYDFVGIDKFKLVKNISRKIKKIEKLFEII